MIKRKQVLRAKRTSVDRLESQRRWVHAIYIGVLLIVLAWFAPQPQNIIMCGMGNVCFLAYILKHS